MRAGDITIDYRYCSGCRICYDICPTDVYGWNEDEKLPIVAYPGECWHCGACELDCPEDGFCSYDGAHAFSRSRLDRHYRI